MFWPKHKPPKSYLKRKPDTIEAWLVSDNPAEQQLAQEALEQLGTDTAKDYLWSLCRREQQIVVRRAIVYLTLFLSIITLAVCTRFIGHNRDLGNFFFLLMHVNNMLNLLFNFNATKVSQLQRYLAEDAAKSENIKDIRILIYSFRMMDLEIHASSTQALTRLLPGLTFADRGLLDLKQWKHLHQTAQRARKPQLLQKESDIAFVCSCLQALGTVRYEAALPLMKEIADKEFAKPEHKELKRIAAHYVAVWDKPSIAQPTTTVTERQPVEEKQMLWYRNGT